MSKPSPLKPTAPRVGIAILSTRANSGAELQLLPAGEFRARDGRPAEIRSWYCNADLAATMIAKANARKARYVIDYEHQTILSEKNGQPAPASGWFKTLEWREGDGLYATDVAWTARARAMIDADEYLYISPVFSYDPKTGAVLDIKHVALTNDPALDDLGELLGDSGEGNTAVLSAYAHRFSDPSNPNNQEISEMDLLKKLLAAIGLADTTTEDDAVKAVVALKAQADQAGTLQTEVAALKTASTTATPDPAKFVPIETMKDLQTQVAALSTRINAQEQDGVVTEALKAGKLLPAQEAWARTLPVASLKTYLETAPVVVPLTTQTGGKSVGQGDGKTLSAEELAVCKALGMSEEEFAKK